MKILDPSGKEVILRGVNGSGMEWGAGVSWQDHTTTQTQFPYGRYAPPWPSMAKNLQSWSFNTVRVPIAWANLENVDGGPYNQHYLEDLDTLVQQLADQHLAVIFSMHQWDWSPVFKAPKPVTGELIHGNGWPVWLYPDDWFTTNPVTLQPRNPPLTNESDGQQAASREFFRNKRIVHGKPIQDCYVDLWTFLAQHYANFPNVIGADMMNEPYGYQNDELEQLYLKTGQAIAAAAPNWLLIFEKGISGGTLAPGIFLGTAGFPDKRAVYSFHLYVGSWDDPSLVTNNRLGRNLVDHELALAQQWGVPFWIGEFHCIMVPDQSLVNQDQTRKMLNYYYRDGPGGNGICNISWTYWAYQRDRLPLDGEAGTGPVNYDLLNALLSFSGVHPQNCEGYP